MIQRLDESVVLILGGDIIDAPRQALTGEHKQAYDEILNRSNRCPVIWIEGNHDDGLRPAETNNIRFSLSHTIDKHVFIAHGDRFDNVTARSRRFISLFKIFHRFRVKLGAHPVHVADYAKKFGYLYRYFRRKVMYSAIDHGKAQHFTTVVCGHVHYAEDSLVEGIRYVNLGSWTESPSYCLLVDGESITLVPVENALQNRAWFRAD